MDIQRQSGSEKPYIAKAIEIFVRLGFVFLLAAMCFEIVRPFLLPLGWAIIIAIGSHPPYCTLRALLGERDKLAAWVFTVLTLVLIMIPIVLLTESLVTGARSLAHQLQGHALSIPAPPASVAAWPLIGKPLYAFWALASQNLAAAARKLEPEIKQAAGVLLARAVGVGRDILYFILAVVLAGFLLANTPACIKSLLAVSQRLVGSHAQELLSLVETTIRNVSRGVLGVAAIQATMAGIGFVVAGIPAAGLWAFFAFILSVIQVGPALVIIPLIIYVFSTSNGLTAILFLLWNVLVLVSHSFLQPLVMARGAKVPALVIVFGAIGGFITMGIIGLFVGAIVLAVGYELARAWIYDGSRVADKAHTL